MASPADSGGELEMEVDKRGPASPGPSAMVMESQNTETTLDIQEPQDPELEDPLEGSSTQNSAQNN